LDHPSGNEKIPHLLPEDEKYRGAATSTVTRKNSEWLGVFELRERVHIPPFGKGNIIIIIIIIIIDSNVPNWIGNVC